MRAEALIERLDGVRRKSNGGWLARCPAHEDRQPSLSVDLSASGGIILKCFAGCEVTAIMDALGLGLSDLFDDAPTPRSAPVAVAASAPVAAATNGHHANVTWFDVRDVAGTVLARHRRVDEPGKKKSMNWWLPGASTPGLAGLKLNSLPLFDITLLADWPTDAPILIVEGEKAATSLVAAGIPALGTVTGAAGCPDVEVLTPLAGRTVILWPDNDEPGRLHMERVGRRMVEAGACCRWYTWTQAPTGGDADDYLATNTANALQADLALAYRWPTDQMRPKSAGITAAELQRKQFAPLRWIVEGMVPEGALLIAGRPKSKKSWLALGISLAVAMNGRALGSLPVLGGRVLYLDLEGNQRRIQERIRTILGRESIAWPENFHLFTAGEWPTGEEALPALVQWFRDYPDTTLVVIDVLQDFRPAIKKGENPYDYDRNTLKAVNQLAEANHATVIIIHHTRKMKSEDAADEISGTLGAPSAVATYWVLSRAEDGKHTILTPNGRDLRHDDKLALLWDPLSCLHTIDGTADQVSLSYERQTILRVLADDRPHSPKEIAMAVGKSVGAVQQMMLDMLHAGQVDRVGIGAYARVPLK